MVLNTQKVVCGLDTNAMPFCIRDLGQDGFCYLPGMFSTDVIFLSIFNPSLVESVDV
jgi:hypothetical protein